MQTKDFTIEEIQLEIFGNGIAGNGISGNGIFVDTDFDYSEFMNFFTEE